MTVSREEFLRLLPVVVGPFEVDAISEAPVVVVVGQASLGRRSAEREGGVPARTRATIRLVPLPDLRLGSIAMPRHRVEIALDDCSGAEGDAVMDCFHRTFMRGGG
jgi:hypothetical protein